LVGVTCPASATGTMSAANINGDVGASFRNSNSAMSWADAVAPILRRWITIKVVKNRINFIRIKLRFHQTACVNATFVFFVKVENSNVELIGFLNDDARINARRGHC